MMDCKKALVEADGDLEAAQDYLRKKGQAKALKKSSRETSEGAVSFTVSTDGKRAGLVKVACETDFVARNNIFQDFISKLANQVSEQGGENVLQQTLVEGEGSVESLLTEKIAELGENMQILDCRKMEISNGVHGGYIHSNGKIGVAVPLETDKPCDDERLKALARDIAMHIAAFPAEAVNADQVSKEVLEKEKEVFTAQARESGKPENIIEKMIEGRLKKFLKEICVESQPFVKDPQLSVSQLVENTAKELGVKINFNNFAKFQF
jgi:elongation factor Ts